MRPNLLRPSMALSLVALSCHRSPCVEGDPRGSKTPWKGAQREAVAQGILCPTGTDLQGRTAPEFLHSFLGCVRPDGTRHGPFIVDEDVRASPDVSSRWHTTRGSYSEGLAVGTWIVRNQFNGDLVRVDTYCAGVRCRTETFPELRREECDDNAAHDVLVYRDGKPIKQGTYLRTPDGAERLSGDEITGALSLDCRPPGR